MHVWFVVSHECCSEIPHSGPPQHQDIAPALFFSNIAGRNPPFTGDL